jgi:hypothetical protein
MVGADVAAALAIGDVAAGDRRRIPQLNETAAAECDEALRCKPSDRKCVV